MKNLNIFHDYSRLIFVCARLWALEDKVWIGSLPLPRKIPYLTQASSS